MQTHQKNSAWRLFSKSSSRTHDRSDELARTSSGFTTTKTVVMEDAQALTTDENSLRKLLKQERGRSTGLLHESVAREMYLDAVRGQPAMGQQNITTTYADFQRMMIKIYFWQNPVPEPDPLGNVDFDYYK